MASFELPINWVGRSSNFPGSVIAFNYYHYNLVYTDIQAIAFCFIESLQVTV